MAKVLTAAIQGQIDAQRIKPTHTFKINTVDRKAFLISWDMSYDKTFGAATANFVLNNTGGIFGDSGANEIQVGDIIEFSELFDGDATDFKRFYGVVEQRSINKTSDIRTITLNCLDYIAALQKTDLDLEVEGVKVKITEETLTPNYLPSPNGNLAQVFDFANNGIAQDPPPIIVIRPKAGINLVTETPQFDGFDVKYALGQLVLGTPLNAQDNYDVIATYYFYTDGVQAEDILEQIITTTTGYSKFFFGESSAADVLANHLTDTFNNVEGTNTDTLTSNVTTSTITIKTTLTSLVTAGDTSINVTSTDGFPTSGTATINGDTFTWTGKTSTTLTGIPASGSDALKDHANTSVVAYEATYAAGRVWYLSYSNITSTLSAGNFSGIDSGVAIDYIDNRFGRIILDAAISVGSTVTHTVDYTFKTLQASGISLNKMKIKPRDLSTRFDAINRLRDFLAPNYIIRTQGDNKIWSSYLSQKATADYTLALPQGINYLEDEDLYTRVVFYGRNINPTNIMFRDGVSFVTTGEDYQATASQVDLTFEKEEGNFLVYKTTISDAGRIDVTTIKPTVFISGVPVNDTPQLIVQNPVVIDVKNRQETDINEHTSGEPDITVRQFFFYKIKFAHTAIDPTQDIICYNATASAVLTISAGDSNMDYGNGIYHVPGTAQNTTIESIATSTYTVFYSTSDISIDFSSVRFKVSKTILPNKDLGTVSATFRYWTAITPIADAGSVIDGRFNTQVQTQFFAEPPTGLNYAIIDLGQIYTIQAIDIVGGFLRPDDIRKFDVNFKFNLQSSLDNVSYSAISSEATNLQINGGEALSLEEDKLGTDFTARYLKLVLEDVKKVEFGDGVWPVAISEVAAYDDIILKSEATLIPTTTLSEDITLPSASGGYPTTIGVDSTAEFTEPGSGETATAYIGTDSFTYTGLQSGNTFIGVEGLSSDHSAGDRVSQTIEGDTTLYDDDGLLPQLGDRLFKQIRISDEILYTQEQLDTLAKAWLKEFYKNHRKISVNVLYAPYLQVGQTVALTDTYNNISNVKYFIESIADRNGFYELVLARFPE